MFSQTQQTRQCSPLLLKNTKHLFKPENSTEPLDTYAQKKAG